MNQRSNDGDLLSQHTGSLRSDGSEKASSAMFFRHDPPRCPTARTLTRPRLRVAAIVVAAMFSVASPAGAQLCTVDDSLEYTPDAADDAVALSLSTPPGDIRSDDGAERDGEHIEDDVAAPQPCVEPVLPVLTELAPPVSIVNPNVVMASAPGEIVARSESTGVSTEVRGVVEVVDAPQLALTGPPAATGMLLGALMLIAVGSILTTTHAHRPKSANPPRD